MNSPSAPSTEGASRVHGYRGSTLLRGACLAGAVSLMGGVAFAQSSAAPAAPAPADESLTWHGITLYGIVDLGLQYLSHGAPISDYFAPGSDDLIQKADGANAITGFTPSNMSQSRVGLQGKESLGVGDWSGVFRLETYFNPQSGDLSDALKSLALNNGKALANQNSGVDSSVAGQLFEQSYVGFSSASAGTFTFGRQNTTLADGIAKYDILNAAQAFSIIGFSGTAAGGGDTEDRRLDQSIKYVGNFNGFHAGAQYKFNGSSGAAGTALELMLGGDFAGASIDAFYTKNRDAVSVSSLSAAQVTSTMALGYSPSNTLSGTISDNTAYALMGSYVMGSTKLAGGYEHIQYSNPDTALPVGYVDEGGYILGVVNNAAYSKQKVLQVYWFGVKETIGKWDMYLAYYGYGQNSYTATGANVGCTSNVAGTCSGNENALSGVIDYNFSKRFDFYFGAMWSQVTNGLANGYQQTNTIDPTLGARFKF